MTEQEEIISLKQKQEERVAQDLNITGGTKDVKFYRRGDR